MTDHAVVIAGAGPTGLMLAGELALAGIDVAILERRPDQQLAGARALGISSRTIEVLDQRGIADRFLSAGQTAQITGFATTRLDISDFPTRHNYGLALQQKHIERLLAAWVTELGVPIRYGREITGFTQHDDAHRRRTRRRARRCVREYLVGMRRRPQRRAEDGGHRLPGLGRDHEQHPRRSRDDGDAAVRRAPFGRRHARLRPVGVRDQRRPDHLPRTSAPFASWSPSPTRARPPSRRCAICARQLVAVCGTDYGAHSPTWISRFTDASRQAARYRQRPRAARRRRRAHPLADRRPRTRHRHPGCREPRLEARAGRPRCVTRRPSRQLSRRAARRRGARASQHHGAGGAAPRGCAHRGGARDHRRAAGAGRGTPPRRRHDVRPRHPLPARRRAPAARTSHARSGRRHGSWRAVACSICCTRRGTSCSISPRRPASMPARGRIGSATSPRSTTAAGSFRSSATSRRPRRC